MSAKWRRSKKRSRRFHVFRDSDKVKNRKNRRTFHIKNSRIKRGAYPCKYRLPKVYRGRWKEPKPLIDILEERNEIIIVAQFVGFKRENLEIHVKNQRLTLSAEASGRKYYKSLNLPKKVTPNTIRTTYKNGVLEIRLKKTIEEKTVDKVVG